MWVSTNPAVAEVCSWESRMDRSTFASIGRGQVVAFGEAAYCGGEVAERRIVEQGPSGWPHAELPLEPVKDAPDGQRVAAEFEEVISEAYLRRSKDLRPDPPDRTGQAALHIDRCASRVQRG